MPTIENSHSISIWLTWMPKICFAKLATIENWCSLIYHEIEAHLQMFASIGYGQ
jgi:hypothetical protein